MVGGASILVLLAIFAAGCSFSPYTDCATDTWGDSVCSMGVSGWLTDPITVTREGKVDLGSLAADQVTTTTTLTTSTTVKKRRRRNR